MGSISVEVTSIGLLMTSDRFGWVQINCAMQEETFNAWHNVEFKLAIQYDPGDSVEAIQKMAIEKALQVTNALGASLSSRDPSSWFDDHLMREDERERDLSAHKQNS